MSSASDGASTRSSDVEDERRSFHNGANSDGDVEKVGQRSARTVTTVTTLALSSTPGSPTPKPSSPPSRTSPPPTLTSLPPPPPPSQMMLKHLPPINLHSPSSILGTPFDAVSRFEYPFPSPSAVPGIGSGAIDSAPSSPELPNSPATSAGSHTLLSTAGSYASLPLSSPPLPSFTSSLASLSVPAHVPLPALAGLPLPPSTRSIAAPPPTTTGAASSTVPSSTASSTLSTATSFASTPAPLGTHPLLPILGAQPAFSASTASTTSTSTSTSDIPVRSYSPTHPKLPVVARAQPPVPPSLAAKKKRFSAALTLPPFSLDAARLPVAHDGSVRGGRSGIGGTTSNPPTPPEKTASSSDTSSMVMVEPVGGPEVRGGGGKEEAKGEIQPPMAASVAAAARRESGVGTRVVESPRASFSAADRKPGSGDGKDGDAKERPEMPKGDSDETIKQRQSQQSQRPPQPQRRPSSPPPTAPAGITSFAIKRPSLSLRRKTATSYPDGTPPMATKEPPNSPDILKGRKPTLMLRPRATSDAILSPPPTSAAKEAVEGKEKPVKPKLIKRLSALVARAQPLLTLGGGSNSSGGGGSNPLTGSSGARSPGLLGNGPRPSTDRRASPRLLAGVAPLVREPSPLVDQQQETLQGVGVLGVGAALTMSSLPPTPGLTLSSVEGGTVLRHRRSFPGAVDQGRIGYGMQGSEGRWI